MSASSASNSLAGHLAEQGICGAAVYFSRPYPPLVRWLLIVGVTFTVLGIAGLAIAQATQ